MKLEAGVSELEAGRLRVGMKARVEAQAKPGEVFEGQLAAIAPEVDERNRHFRIEVRVPNDGNASCCRACTPPRAIGRVHGRADVVLVPSDAVTTRDGKRIVLKVSGRHRIAGDCHRRR